MPRIDLDAIPQINRTGYPPPFDAAVAGRWQRRLGPATGMTDLRASHVVLKPGAWSSQRHWHDGEDEFLVMLTGEAVLIEDGGETLLKSGDMAAWPQGDRDGHHLVNRSAADCSFVCLSAGDAKGRGGYSDIDMLFDGDGYTHRDGTPYETKKPA